MKRFTLHIDEEETPKGSIFVVKRFDEAPTMLDATDIDLESLVKRCVGVWAVTVDYKKAR